jgi:hypothetical protein
MLRNPHPFGTSRLRTGDGPCNPMEPSTLRSLFAYVLEDQRKALWQGSPPARYNPVTDSRQRKRSWNGREEGDSRPEFDVEHIATAAMARRSVHRR